VVASAGWGVAGKGTKSVSVRASRWVALAASALSLVLVVLGLVLAMANRYVENEIATYTFNLVVAALAFSTVGVLVAYRQPQNLIGWLLLGIGALYATELFAGNYGVYTLVTNPGSLPGEVVGAWLTSWVWIFGGSLVLFVFLFFPDGRLPSPRWRPVSWLVLANTVLAVAPFAFDPGPLSEFSERVHVVNPFGIAGSAGLLGVFSRVSFVLLIPISLALIFALFVRFRRARGDERQQIKWVAYGVALFALAVIVASAWPSLDGTLLGGALFLVGFLAIPTAMAVAILQYRLYDIDVVINRTLVYTVLTTVLGFLYFGSIALFQTVLIVLTGQASELAVVASTLLIAALFNPLRRRTQSLVDRRFYRGKYDAAKTLEAFGASLREETDLGQLNEHLLTVVRETMQPEHASLWLAPQGERQQEERGSNVV
jgi:hypothetical protein